MPLEECNILFPKIVQVKSSKMPTKELYFAESMNDLKKKRDFAMGSFSKTDTKRLRVVLEKLFNKAIEATKNYDEEMVYVYSYRALEVWKVIMNSNEYKQDKKFFTLQYGKEIKDMLERFSDSTESLEKRYASKQNPDMETKDGLNVQFELLSSIQIPSKKMSKMKNEERNPQKNLNCNNKIIKSNDYNLIIRENGGSSPSDCIGETFTILCSELWEKITSKVSILIFDIRPTDHFINSKIKNVDSINIPENSIKHGLSAHLLGEKIENDDQKHFWKHRDQYNQVVLMDSSSGEKDIIPGSYLFNLFSILTKWDPNVIYKKKPLILNGGFSCWMDCYPNSTTNKNVASTNRATFDSPNSIFSVQHIEYPIKELEEIISPRPKTTSNVPKNSTNYSDIPFVDRSTKNAIKQFPNIEDKSSNSSSKDSSEQQIKDDNMTNSPDTSEELQRSRTPSPKSHDKGDGDNIKNNTEMLKSDKLPQNTSLKRSASSPNINKVGIDLDLSQNFIPKFDRSTKPNQHSLLDNYHRDAGNDTVYVADSRKAVGLTGLKNLGNLCYMNSIMQCISNTVQLKLELTQFNPKENTNKQLIATEVRSLLRLLWQRDSRTTSCRDLKVKVGKLRQSFSTSEQQDSHEFLTLLMDWLHEDLNNPSSIKSLEGAVELTGEKAWGEFKKKNNSLIVDLFYGQLKSTVTCKTCGKESILFEPFSNLSIPLPPQEYMNNQSCTLQECLRLYLKGEVINGWICPSCKSPREATKKLDITRLPPVLIIHLKRFMTETVGGGWFRKRMEMVEFPIANLDMRPYTPDESEQRFHNYNLYAVSNHYGSMDSGHYTAYCKNHSLKRWYKFDDQDVIEMSQSDVKTSAAYIMFYESSTIGESQ